jgi:type I restriction enzyme S subunit
MKIPFISETQDYITAQAIENSSTKIVPRGSLLMVVRSGILRRHIPVAVTKRPLAINQDIKAIILRADELNPEYLMLVIRGHERSLLQVWRKKGATVESIEHGPLFNTYVPLPPFAEQGAIIEKINEITSQIVLAQESADRQIDLIREYRKRLTSDVVTGKLDVSSLRIEPGEAHLEDVELEVDTEGVESIEGMQDAEEIAVGDD